ncbi:MAG: nitroreductase family protein [Elusimicrobiota bacterium]
MLILDNVSTLAPDAAMSVSDAILARRSVRSYSPQAIGRAVILKLLDAAVHAPTAVHEEPWAFVVVQDRETLKRLSDKAKEMLPDLQGRVHLRDGSSHHFLLPDNVFYDAGTLIAIYGKPLGPFVAADCWLAAENLMLAARAMELGTCVIGLAVAALNTPEWKAALKVPPEMTAYAPIIVGLPAGETPPTERREPEILSWKTSLKA